MARELEDYLNVDGTISARKVRGSIGSRRNRRDGTKACRKNFSKKSFKHLAGVQIKMHRKEVEAMRLAKLLAPIEVVAEAEVVAN